MSNERHGKFDEIGAVGQKRYSGTFYEEYIKDLQGRKGMLIYQEMTSNDEVIGAIKKTIELLVRQASWYVKPASEDALDKKAAEFVESCLKDLSTDWKNVLSEMLSFLDFGWAYHEIVYKLRKGSSADPRFKSKFDDNLIGWRKLPIRAQDTLWAWDIPDNSDDILGMIQHPPPTYTERNIPLTKAVHLISTSIKENPEGRSMWRSAYRPWYFKKHIQEIEGIGIERDLAGLPVMTTPEGTQIWTSNDPGDLTMLATAKSIVTNIRRDSLEGVVKPFGWELELLSSGGARQFDTSKIIERWDTRIAMVGLADFILMGHQNVGSFALASSKTNLFSVALGAWLDCICDAMNSQAIPQLIDLNVNAFKGIKAYPTLEHSDVETPDLAELGTFIKDMTGVGVIIPGPNLEKYVRTSAGIPEEEEGFKPTPQPNVNTEEKQTEEKTDGRNTKKSFFKRLISEE